MEIKVSEGTASFNSELQNDPIDPESATFNPEWFDYYEPELMDFSSPEFVFVGANDPSLGKNKKSDTSSIINLGVEHTREFRVIWHEEHNLIFLDGTWSLDGSKIIDAWQKTEVL